MSGAGPRVSGHGEPGLGRSRSGEAGAGRDRLAWVRLAVRRSGPGPLSVAGAAEQGRSRAVTA